MRKIIITLGILFVLFIIVCGLALLNLNFFINSNKEFFISQIEQTLGRSISVSEINTGFRNGFGIRLKEVLISDDDSFSDSEFIQAQDIQINVEIIPLLNKKIQINKLILNRPVINIIENKSGKYNFESIASGSNPSKKSKDKTNNQKKSLALFASSIIIKQGQIYYTNEKSETEFQVQKINLSIKDLGLENKIPLNLEAAVLSSDPNIKIGGKVGPLGSELNFLETPLEGNLEITDINVNNLKKFFPTVKKHIPQGLDISGPLDMSLLFSGTPNALMLSSIEMNASVFGASVPNLQLSGRVGPIGKSSKHFSLDTKFNLKKANLSKLRNFSLIKDSIPNSLSSQGTLDFGGKIKGTNNNFEFSSVRLDATNCRLAIIGKFLKPKNSPFIITTGGKISDSVVEITNSEIVLNTLKLKANGKIHRGTTNLINLLISSNKIDLAAMNETFPSLREYNPSGVLEVVQINLTGELGKGQVPQLHGALLLSDVSITPTSFPRPISNINTRVNFTGNSADIKNMSLNLGQSRLNISAKIDKFSPLSLSYKISSPELHLSDINKKAEPKEAESFKELQSQGKISHKHDALTAKGNLLSSKAKIAGYELKDIETKFTLIAETLKIEDLSVKAYEGLIKANASYSLGEDSDFSIISNIRGLNLRNFLSSRESKNAEKIQGKANLDINIFGTGRNWNEIKNTLKGTAKSEIIDGAVLNINLADEVLRGLTGVPGLTFLGSPSTKEKYPQVFSSQDTTFDEFRSSFIIDKGKMETKDLKITSKDYLITGKGWMNLDGKVNLKSQLALSETFSDDLKTDIPDLKYIANNKNRIVIPFSITGMLPKAKVKPDIPYIAKLVQRSGIREVIKELSSGSDETEEQTEDGLNQVEEQAPAKKEKKRIDKKIIDELKDLF